MREYLQWPDCCCLQEQWHLPDPTSSSVHSKPFGTLIFHGENIGDGAVMNLEAQSWYVFAETSGCIGVQSDCCVSCWGMVTESKEGIIWHNASKNKPIFCPWVIVGNKIKVICQSSSFLFQVILLLETAIGLMKSKAFLQSKFSLFHFVVLIYFLSIRHNYLDNYSFLKNRHYKQQKIHIDLFRKWFSTDHQMGGYICTVENYGLYKHNVFSTFQKKLLKVLFISIYIDLNKK